MSVSLLSNRKRKGGLIWTTLLHRIRLAHRRQNPPLSPDGPSRFCRIISLLQHQHAEGHMPAGNPLGLEVSHMRDLQPSHLENSAKP
ncbi:MAG TPA: hypothetical protein DD706_11335 [Nitrospiraceae bacterium]|nr:hypothetical protein [Nitrospiraceae bacterium]